MMELVGKEKVNEKSSIVIDTEYSNFNYQILVRNVSLHQLSHSP